MIGQAARQNAAFMANLSEEDRLALIRGRGLPSRLRAARKSRLVRGVSEEASGLFTLLERAGGERSVRSLVPAFSGFLSAAGAELAGLGLAERVESRGEPRWRLTPSAQGVALMSSWSMRG